MDNTPEIFQLVPSSVYRNLRAALYGIFKFNTTEEIRYMMLGNKHCENAYEPYLDLWEDSFDRIYCVTPEVEADAYSSESWALYGEGATGKALIRETATGNVNLLSGNVYDFIIHPTIYSYSVQPGSVCGSWVTISGSGFSTTTSNNKVYVSRYPYSEVYQECKIRESSYSEIYCHFSDGEINSDAALSVGGLGWLHREFEIDYTVELTDLLNGNVDDREMSREIVTSVDLYRENEKFRGDTFEGFFYAPTDPDASFRFFVSSSGKAEVYICFTPNVVCSSPSLLAYVEDGTFYKQFFQEDEQISAEYTLAKGYYFMKIVALSYDDTRWISVGLSHQDDLNICVGTPSQMYIYQKISIVPENLAEEILIRVFQTKEGSMKIAFDYREEASGEILWYKETRELSVDIDTSLLKQIFEEDIGYIVQVTKTYLDEEFQATTKSSGFYIIQYVVSFPEIRDYPVLPVVFDPLGQIDQDNFSVVWEESPNDPVSGYFELEFEETLSGRIPYDATPSYMEGELEELFYDYSGLSIFVQEFDDFTKGATWIIRYFGVQDETKSYELSALPQFLRGGQADTIPSVNIEFLTDLAPDYTALSCFYGALPGVLMYMEQSHPQIHVETNGEISVCLSDTMNCDFFTSNRIPGFSDIPLMTDFFEVLAAEEIEMTIENSKCQNVFDIGFDFTLGEYWNCENDDYYCQDFDGYFKLGCSIDYEYGVPNIPKYLDFFDPQLHLDGYGFICKDPTENLQPFEVDLTWEIVDEIESCAGGQEITLVGLGYGDSSNTFVYVEGQECDVLSFSENTIFCQIPYLHNEVSPLIVEVEVYNSISNEEFTTSVSLTCETPHEMGFYSASVTESSFGLEYVSFKEVELETDFNACDTDQRVYIFWFDSTSGDIYQDYFDPTDCYYNSILGWSSIDFEYQGHRYGAADFEFRIWTPDEGFTDYVVFETFIELEASLSAPQTISHLGGVDVYFRGINFEPDYMVVFRDGEEDPNCNTIDSSLIICEYLEEDYFSDQEVIYQIKFNDQYERYRDIDEGTFVLDLMTEIYIDEFEVITSDSEYKVIMYFDFDGLAACETVPEPTVYLGLLGRSDGIIQIDADQVVYSDAQCRVRVDLDKEVSFRRGEIFVNFFESGWARCTAEGGCDFPIVNLIDDVSIDCYLDGFEELTGLSEVGGLIGIFGDGFEEADYSKNEIFVYYDSEEEYYQCDTVYVETLSVPDTDYISCILDMRDNPLDSTLVGTESEYIMKVKIENKWFSDSPLLRLDISNDPPVIIGFTGTDYDALTETVELSVDATQGNNFSEDDGFQVIFQSTFDKTYALWTEEVNYYTQTNFDLSFTFSEPPADVYRIHVMRTSELSAAGLPFGFVEISGGIDEVEFGLYIDTSSTEKIKSNYLGGAPLTLIGFGFNNIDRKEDMTITVCDYECEIEDASYYFVVCRTPEIITQEINAGHSRAYPKQLEEIISETDFSSTMTYSFGDLYSMYLSSIKFTQTSGNCQVAITVSDSKTFPVGTTVTLFSKSYGVGVTATETISVPTAIRTNWREIVWMKFATDCTVSSLSVTGIVFNNIDYPFTIMQDNYCDVKVTVNNANPVVLSEWVLYLEDSTMLAKIVDEYYLDDNSIIQLQFDRIDEDVELTDLTVEIDDIGCGMLSFISSKVIECFLPDKSRGHSSNPVQVTKLETDNQGIGHVATFPHSVYWPKKWINVFGADRDIAADECWLLNVDPDRTLYYENVVLRENGMIIFENDQDTSTRLTRQLTLWTLTIGKGTIFIGFKNQNDYQMYADIGIIQFQKPTWNQGASCSDQSFNIISSAATFVGISIFDRFPYLKFVKIDYASSADGDVIQVKCLSSCYIQEGDEIVISSSTEYYTDEELKTILAFSQSGSTYTITLDSPLENEHYNNEGYIGVLNRDVAIRGDSACEDERTGFAFRFSNGGSSNDITFQSAEIRNYGITPTPTPGTNEFIVDAGGKFLDYSILDNDDGNVVGMSVYKSYYRGITLNEESDIQIKENTFYDIHGSALVLANGVPEDNVIQDNFFGSLKKIWDILLEDMYPSAIVISSLRNEFRDNVMIGGEGHGYWFDLKNYTSGLYNNPSACPSSQKNPVFSGNYAQSNQFSGMHFSRAYFPLSSECQIIKKWHEEYPYLLSSATEFKDFISIRNRGSGIYAQGMGYVRLTDMVLLDNGRYGIEVQRTDYTDVYNKPFEVKNFEIGLSRPNKHTIGLAAISLPHTDGFKVTDSTFRMGKAEEYYAITTCSTCIQDRRMEYGAREAIFKGIQWTYSDKSISSLEGFIDIDFPYTQILWDVDGSLTGNADSWSTTKLAHLEQQCTESALFSQGNGYICGGSSEASLRRITLFDVTPEIMFWNESISYAEVLNIDTPGFSSESLLLSGLTQTRPNLVDGSFNATWHLPLLTGKDYQVFWSKYSPTNIILEKTFYWESGDDPIRIYFNFTDNSIVRIEVYFYAYQDSGVVKPVSILKSEGIPVRNETTTDASWYATENFQHMVLYLADSSPGFIDIRLSRCLIEACVSNSASVTNNKFLYHWSDPEAWLSSSYPKEGDDVIIPEEYQVILDTSPPCLGTLTVQGDLYLDEVQSSLELCVSNLHIDKKGSFIIGNSTRPTATKFTLKFDPSSKSEDLSIYQTELYPKGTLVVTGKLEVYGPSPSPNKFVLAQEAKEGDNKIRVTFLNNGASTEFSWEIGTTILLTSSEFGISQSETRTIKSISKVSDTVYELVLDSALEYYHYGSNQVFENSHLLSETEEFSISYASIVTVVSRNIKFEGTSETNSLVITSSYESSLLYSPDVVLDGVEFISLGFLSEDLAAVNIIDYTGTGYEGSNLTTKSVLITNSVIRNSNGAGLRCYNSTNLSFTRNIVTDSVMTGIYINECDYTIIQKNTIDSTYKPTDLKESTESYELSAGMMILNENIGTQNVEFSLNSITASEEYGLVAMGDRCGDSESIFDNFVVSAEVGMFFYLSSADSCLEISYQTVSKTQQGIVAYANGTSIRVSHLTLTDNIDSLSLVLADSNPEARFSLSNSYFKAFGRTDCSNCNEISSSAYCSNRTAVRFPQATEGYKVFPPTKDSSRPWRRITTPPVAYSSFDIVSITLENFGKDFVEIDQSKKSFSDSITVPSFECVGNRFMRNSEYGSDPSAIASLSKIKYVSGLTTTTKNQVAEFASPNPNWASVDVCAGSQCSGPLNIYIMSEDETVLQATGSKYSGKTYLVPRDYDGVRVYSSYKWSCEYYASWTGYACEQNANIRLGIFVIEDATDSKYSYKFYPVTFKNFDMFDADVNGYRDYGEKVDGNLGRIVALLVVSRIYEVKSTNDWPTKFTIRYYGDQFFDQNEVNSGNYTGSFTLLRLKLRRSRIWVIRNSAGEIISAETSLWTHGLDDYHFENKFCGAHRFRDSRDEIEILIANDAGCYISVESTPGIKYQLMFAMRPEDFYEEESHLVMIREIAAYVGLPESQIRLNEVYRNTTTTAYFDILLLSDAGSLSSVDVDDVGFDEIDKALDLVYMTLDSEVDLGIEGDYQQMQYMYVNSFDDADNGSLILFAESTAVFGRTGGSIESVSEDDDEEYYRFWWVAIIMAAVFLCITCMILMLLLYYCCKACLLAAGKKKGYSGYGASGMGGEEDGGNRMLVEKTIGGGGMAAGGFGADEELHRAKRELRAEGGGMAAEGVEGDEELGRAKRGRKEARDGGALASGIRNDEDLENRQHYAVAVEGPGIEKDHAGLIFGMLGNQHGHGEKRGSFEVTDTRAVTGGGIIVAGGGGGHRASIDAVGSRGLGGMKPEIGKVEGKEYDDSDIDMDMGDSPRKGADLYFAGGALGFGVEMGGAAGMIGMDENERRRGVHDGGDDLGVLAVTFPLVNQGIAGQGQGYGASGKEMREDENLRRKARGRGSNERDDDHLGALAMTFPIVNQGIQPGRMQGDEGDNRGGRKRRGDDHQDDDHLGALALTFPVVNQGIQPGGIGTDDGDGRGHRIGGMGHEEAHGGLTILQEGVESRRAGKGRVQDQGMRGNRLGRDEEEGGRGPRRRRGEHEDDDVLGALAVTFPIVNQGIQPGRMQGDEGDSGEGMGRDSEDHKKSKRRGQRERDEEEFGFKADFQGQNMHYDDEDQKRRRKRHDDSHESMTPVDPNLAIAFPLVNQAIQKNAQGMNAELTPGRKRKGKGKMRENEEEIGFIDSKSGSEPQIEFSSGSKHNSGFDREEEDRRVSKQGKSRRRGREEEKEEEMGMQAPGLAPVDQKVLTSVYQFMREEDDEGKRFK